MSAQRKLSKVAEAYERAKPIRQVLREVGARCMEATEDKCGILWERWIIVRQCDAMSEEAINIIVYATPHGWDALTSVVASNLSKDTLDAVRQLAVDTWKPE